MIFQGLFRRKYSIFWNRKEGGVNVDTGTIRYNNDMCSRMAIKAYLMHGDYLLHGNKRVQTPK